ncbi:MAG: Amylo-alpha-1,6-glucosidase [Pelotomaculum sp. PtaU1.Bin035]|nr:MAG: Amylo-alpha-1,6-glucosidase [Pelotomaculum sp. PtaU1.Bin035]
MYFFGKSDWRTFERGIEKEWLVTNGIGGYASSTIIGANTRKYHGLLVAAHNPPGRRMVRLVKLDERLSAGGRTYNLATNNIGCGVSESGYIHLQQVVIDHIPIFTYSFADITLEKTIFMVHGQNTTIILYRIANGAGPGVLRLTPMVNCRGYHFITSEGQIEFTQMEISSGVSIKSREDVPPLLLATSTGSYIPGGWWFRGMSYPIEKERGENYLEDHYIPGFFEVPLGAGENKTVTVIASTVVFGDIAGEELLEKERYRLKDQEDRAGYDDMLASQLVRASDAFIVRRQSTGSKTVIAGYPWFTDWGRDTMIALPGLTLVTKRFEEAREILLTYARQCKKGLLPNCFLDGAEYPVFNAVDASLWYFNAVYKYLIYTGDLDFIRDQIYPVLKDIIHWYMNGTDFNIYMDQDGLLSTGTPDVQLTWMDAKIDGWVVTPRNGKAVEINALWYNALCIMENLARIYGDKPSCRDLGSLVKRSFICTYWSESEGYLCDVISPEGKDWRVRPNQLLAVSLPYSMLAREQGCRVVRRVWRELYATYGIRSLSPEHSEYKGVYVGDRVQRDSSYHQGTAWSWLMGPFVTAYRRVHNYSAASREQACRFLSPFRDHLRDQGIGYISEIFDGNEPVIPRGCFAQAWGVAEVLRAYVEDVLEIQPPAAEKVEALIRRE